MNIFGFNNIKKSESKIRIIPAPFAPTTSFRQGCELGPKAILSSSIQVDLCDHLVGNLEQANILWEDNNYSKIYNLHIEGIGSNDIFEIF